MLRDLAEAISIPIFRQKGQPWIFGPKFAQTWILGSEFEKSKSGFEINTSKIPCMPIFSQNGQLLIFRPKFGEIAQLRAIFCFKYYWGCFRELGGGWNELGGGGWSWVEVEMSWVEVDGVGWRWVYGLVLLAHHSAECKHWISIGTLFKGCKKTLLENIWIIYTLTIWNLDFFEAKKA